MEEYFWQCNRNDTRAKQRGGGKSGVGVAGYNCQIKYKYSVEGKQYQGDRMSAYETTETFKMVEEAREFCYDLPKGRYIKVYYNPDEPSSAIIYQKNKPSWRYGLTALFIWIFTICVVRVELRKRTESKA